MHWVDGPPRARAAGSRVRGEGADKAREGGEQDRPREGKDCCLRAQRVSSVGAECSWNSRGKL